VAHNAFRRRAPVGGGRARRNLVWTVQLFADAVATPGAGAIHLNLADNTMWSLSSLSVQKATVVRIRGTLAIRRSSAFVGSWFANIRVVRSGEGLFDPGVIAAYQNEPVMWTAAGIFGSTDLAQPPLDIDVKAKRKINDDEIVVLGVGVVGASAEVTFTVLARTLLMLGS